MTARTIITKYITREFPLPADPYTRGCYPNSMRYINMRLAALRRAYPEATNVRHYAGRNGQAIQVILPIRHRYPKPAWRVYATAFHGGGLISAHYTREAADQAARRWASGDCCCGCAGVIAPDEQPGDAPTFKVLSTQIYPQ